VTHHESGRVPRTIDVELSRDLCDSAAPGDVVFVSGVVRIRTITESRLGADEPMSVLHVHALSVVKCNGGNNGRASGSTLGIEFSPADYMLVQEIHAIGPLIFKLLVHSLCPSIYGHELVKAGLLLCLFGGA
jgi:DNA helicase MCM8